MKKLSVVISVYNENPNLEVLLSKLLENKVSGYQYEYIFVDDGSTDESEKKLRSFAAENGDIQVVSLTRNFGHEIAMTAGMDHATGDAVIFMDADLQHPPEILPEFIKEWEGGKLIVLGKRIWNPPRSTFYCILSDFYHWLFTFLAGFDASRDCPDFRLIDRYYVEKLKDFREQARMFRGFVAWMGAKKDISEVEFEAPERSAGRSKYNLRSLVNLGLDAIFAFSQVPMRLALILSLVGLAFSFGLGLYLYIPYVFEGIHRPGFLTIIFTVLIMGSAQLFILALFAEYIGRIHFETKKRPLYIVRKSPGPRDE